VIGAFRNVPDARQAIGADARVLRAAIREFRLGEATTLQLLNAQQSYLQALLAVAQARANRYANTVTLFHALGGGWWNRAQPQRESLMRQCSNELVQRPFPNLQRNSVMPTGLTDDASKFLFVDKLLSRLDGMPYLVGKPWRGPGKTWCTRRAATAMGSSMSAQTNTIGLRTECRR
jgi:hypothetical protein